MATRKRSFKSYKCERCGYEWLPRKQDGEPKRCASCRTPYWNKTKKEKKPE